jgi:two-component system, NarL family, response regulator NreC
MHKNIVICDDHSLFLNGLIQILNNREYQNVSGFTDSESCKKFIRQYPPDVFICDLNIDNVDGFTLIEELKNELKDAKVIILSAYYEDSLIQKARKIGAHGFLKKESSAEELIDVIEEDKGSRFFTNNSLRKTVNDFTVVDDSVANKFRLSKQEKEIIRLIIEGKTSKEIGEILFISKTTVDTHRRNINKKLEISNSSSLIKFAHENNLFS